MSWQLLVLSLPTENATARMRAWRALKASGAAVLRDGVYLMPAAGGHAESLQAVADDVDAEHLSPDYQPLDLAGPLPDLGQLGVAHEALDLVLLNITVATVNLDAHVGDAL